MNNKSAKLGQNSDFIAGEASPKINDYKGFDEEFEDALSTPQNLVVGYRFENEAACLKTWIESESKYSDPPKIRDLDPLKNAILQYAEFLSPQKTKKNRPTHRSLKDSISIISKRGGIKEFKSTNNLLLKAMFKLEKCGIKENNINFISILKQQIISLKTQGDRNKKNNKSTIERLTSFVKLVADYKECLTHNKSAAELDLELREFKVEIDSFKESRNLPPTTPTLEVMARMIIQHEAQRPFFALYRFLIEAGIIEHEGQHYWIDDSKIRQMKKRKTARLKKSRYRAE